MTSASSSRLPSDAPGSPLRVHRLPDAALGDEAGDEVVGEAAERPADHDPVEHGIRIWHFQPSMLHAKVMTVDGRVANIGSANLNARSVTWDEEINLVALDPDLVAILDAHFDADLDRSVRIRPGRWQRRPLHQRAAERLLVPVRKLF